VANFNAVARTNSLASPVVNSAAVDYGGRVRISWDEYITIGTETDGVPKDTFTFGAELIPAGSRIMDCRLQTEDLSAGSRLTLAVGNANPITTAVITTVAGTIAVADEIGVVLTAPAFPVLTLDNTLGTLNADKYIRLWVKYVLD